MMKIALLLFLIFVTKTSCDSFEDLLNQISTKEEIPALSQIRDKYRQKNALLDLAGEFSLSQGFICFMHFIRTNTNGIFHDLQLNEVTKVEEVDWPKNFEEIIKNYDYVLKDGKTIRYKTHAMKLSYQKWYSFLALSNKHNWNGVSRMKSEKLQKALQQHYEKRHGTIFKDTNEEHYYSTPTLMHQYVAAVLARSYILGVLFTHGMNGALYGAIDRNAKSGGTKDFVQILRDVLPLWYFTADMVEILNIVYREVLDYPDHEDPLMIGEIIQTKFLKNKLHDVVIPCSYYQCMHYHKSVPYLHKYLTTSPTPPTA